MCGLLALSHEDFIISVRWVTILEFFSINSFYQTLCHNIPIHSRETLIKVRTNGLGEVSSWEGQLFSVTYWRIAFFIWEGHTLQSKVQFWEWWAHGRLSRKGCLSSQPDQQTSSISSDADLDHYLGSQHDCKASQWLERTHSSSNWPFSKQDHEIDPTGKIYFGVPLPNLFPIPNLFLPASFPFLWVPFLPFTSSQNLAYIFLALKSPHLGHLDNRRKIGS